MPGEFEDAHQADLREGDVHEPVEKTFDDGHPVAAECGQFARVECPGTHQNLNCAFEEGHEDDEHETNK